MPLIVTINLDAQEKMSGSLSCDIYNGILHSFKECDHAIHYNMDGPVRYNVK